LQGFIDTATQLHIIVCTLFQVKCHNINTYALISYGLSKFLGNCHEAKPLTPSLPVGELAS